MGIGGAALVMIALGVFTVMTIPTFAPADEAAHYGYINDVLDGHLPTLDSPIRPLGIAPLSSLLDKRNAERRTIWTANHPPLYYAVTAIPVQFGRMTSTPLVAIRLARLFGIICSLMTLVLAALITRRLVPDRPDAAIGAACFVAVLPGLLQVSTILYNDALSIAACTAVLLAGLRLIDEGPRRDLTCWFAAACSLALATRVSSFLIVATTMVGVSWSLFAADGAWTARVRRIAAVSGVVAAGAVATSGWFWIRNVRLYGSITAESALLTKFERSPKAMTFDLLPMPRFWLLLQRKMWDLGNGYPMHENGPTRHFWTLSLLPLGGLVLAASRRTRTRVLQLMPSSAHTPWLATGVFAAFALVYTTARFWAMGGNPHSRYLLPAVGVVASLAGIGLARLGRHVALAFLILGGSGYLVMLTKEVTTLIRRPTPWRSLEAALHSADLSYGFIPWFVVLLLVVAASGVTAVGWSLMQLSAPTNLEPERTTEPEPVATSGAETAVEHSLGDLTHA